MVAKRVRTSRMPIEKKAKCSIALRRRYAALVPIGSTASRMRAGLPAETDRLVRYNGTGI